MAKLLFSLDGKSLGEFLLEKERMTIGRRPGNDIHIDNLAVSGEHAVILTLGSDSFLEDLNSTNGTMVNKKVIKKHVLLHNDLIEFGNYQLMYLADNQTKVGGPDAIENAAKSNATAQAKEPATPSHEGEVSDEMQDAETRPISTSQSVDPTSTIETSSQNVDLISDSAHLQVLNGDNAGQELLLNRAMVKLGSAGGQLALITKRPHGFFVSHVDGKGRPLVNGQVIGTQAFALKNHDVIELSGIKMEVIL
ncbi:MAG: FHA domain-containing protein [Methylophilaceae bacterium]